MGLGLSNDSGEFIPFVKYDARAGRVSVKTDSGEIEDVPNLVAVFDMQQIGTGWIMFANGMAPSWFPDAKIGEAGVRPSDKHKRGFKVNVFSQKLLGGMREMAGNSRVLNDAISALYELYEAAPESKRGMLPVVSISGTTPVKSQTKEGGMTTNYAPKFQIDKWVQRPAALPLANGAAADEPDEDPVPAPAAARGNGRAAPAPVGADAPEF